MTKHLLKRTEAPLLRALSDAKISAKDINEVILIGGSTRMPAVQDVVRTLNRKNT